MNWLHRRLCMLFALAVFLLVHPAVVGQDTLRPQPWIVGVWDGSSFQKEHEGQRRLTVPLVLNRVDISALGSPAWDFQQGLVPRVGIQSSFLGFWKNSDQSNMDAWSVRKGPLPIVDWIGQAAHGRGQDFGVVASASPRYYQHFWVDFRRLQMAGGLLPEDHFNDRLKAAFWGRDSARHWRYNVQFGIQRNVDGESGGVVRTEALTTREDWQPNRNLISTRWSSAERSGRTLTARVEWIHARSNIGLVADWSRSTHGFGGAPASVDSLGYMVLDVRLKRGSAARWSEPAMRGVSTIAILPRIRPEWSVGLRSVTARTWNSGIWMEGAAAPRISPVAGWRFLGRRHKVRTEVDVLGQAAEVSYSLHRYEQRDPLLAMEGLQRWTMPWEGEVVQHVRRAELLVRPIKQFAVRAVASSPDPLLRVLSWEDVNALWGIRSSWAMASAEWNTALKFSPTWSLKMAAQGRWASSRELGLAPGNAAATLVYASPVAGLFPGMRVQFELSGQAWTGGWQRPVWVAEKGLFGLSAEQDAMPAGGLLHAAAIVYLGEAQLGIVAQNANQGWVPNTVFMAQHYPVPPASLRWFLRWRMFE